MMDRDTIRELAFILAQNQLSSMKINPWLVAFMELPNCGLPVATSDLVWKMEQETALFY